MLYYTVSSLKNIQSFSPTPTVTCSASISEQKNTKTEAPKHLKGHFLSPKNRGNCITVPEFMRHLLGQIPLHLLLVWSPERWVVSLIMTLVKYRVRWFFSCMRLHFEDTSIHPTAASNFHSHRCQSIGRSLDFLPGRKSPQNLRNSRNLKKGHPNIFQHDPNKNIDDQSVLSLVKNSETWPQFSWYLRFA